MCVSPRPVPLQCLKLFLPSCVSCLSPLPLHECKRSLQVHWSKAPCQLGSPGKNGPKPQTHHAVISNLRCSNSYVVLCESNSTIYLNKEIPEMIQKSENHDWNSAGNQDTDPQHESSNGEWGRLFASSCVRSMSEYRPPLRLYRLRSSPWHLPIRTKGCRSCRRGNDDVGNDCQPWAFVRTNWTCEKRQITSDYLL